MDAALIAIIQAQLAQLQDEADAYQNDVIERERLLAASQALLAATEAKIATLQNSMLTDAVPLGT